MPVLVASKFEEDLIENEHHFFPQRARNSKMIDQIWPYFELVQDFMPVFIICKLDGD